MPPQRRQSWQDVADVQADLARWYDTDHGERWLTIRWKSGADGLSPETSEMLRSAYAGEPDRIRGADPIFISSEMVEVVDAAMGSFDPEPLVPFDLMTPTGFIYLERPIEVTDRYDEPTYIQGFSWVPAFSTDFAKVISTEMADMGVTFTPEGIAVETAVTPRQEYSARLLSVLQKHSSDFTDMASLCGVMLTIYSTRDIEMPGAPPLLPIHCTPWWFGMSYDGNDVDEVGKPTGAGWWWRILQTTLRLMQQQLATSSRYRPDKAGRRSLAKARMPDDRDVIVVRLRREKQPGIEGGPHSEANYSHRFIRNGHWRQQPYPSEGPNVVRQIWIHSTIVGDESLPLIIRPNRAYVLTR